VRVRLNNEKLDKLAVSILALIDGENVAAVLTVLSKITCLLAVKCNFKREDILKRLEDTLDEAIEDVKKEGNQWTTSN